ncbi:uncharacterized protein LOC127804697 [Diospyros lotus]|uniref:uncharacterized protein LOC127804697 n=1 Tax=Diospyros lotus TaxID=55363 RepID=UPI00225C1897|nr:uncharacterized protein LOC127804697 [Diospyros lotus]
MVGELLLRIQQVEARHGAHDMRESHEEKTPFSREIELEPLPRRFKVPSIPQYNGDSDPFDHLDAFNVQMDLQTSSSLAKCRAFPATLGDIPRAWLRRLHSHSIYYIERFKREVNNVESPSDESILTAIFAGLRKDGKFYESIYKSLVRDLGEFYEQAAKEVRWEEMFGLKKPGDQKKVTEHTGQSKKRADEDSRKEGQKRSPNDQATKKIFTTERNKEDFRRPNPLKTPDKYRTKSKFCAYHNEVEHTTSECWALKDAIEELIRRGRLHDYVVRPRDHQPKQPAQQNLGQAPE